MNFDYEMQLDAMYTEMVAWRRHLHQNPELSFHEVNTAKFIAEYLNSWGLDVTERVGGHGVTALLQGGKPGPTVALRADIDALPIQDEKNCPYASKVTGVMHACGHDAHTATLLAVAKLLSKQQAGLSGNVLFIFQHAEEISPGGAKSMIEAGVLQGVDVIYGVHLWTPLPVGEVYCAAGPIMAAVDDFTIEIHGKGGHGGLPHNTVDSIVVGSHLVVNLQSIISRSINPIEPCVISVGTVQAGGSFNVIAERCLIKGTVRSFNAQVRVQLEKRLRQVTDQTCSMFGAEYTLEYKSGYPSVVNHADEAERFFTVNPALFGVEHVKKSPNLMVGEDYGYYLQQIKGCFMLVGAGNELEGYIYPHHHPKFDLDESSMLNSAKLLINMTLHYQNNG